MLHASCTLQGSGMSKASRTAKEKENLNIMLGCRIKVDDKFVASLEQRQNPSSKLNLLHF